MGPRPPHPRPWFGAPSFARSSLALALSFFVTGAPAPLLTMRLRVLLSRYRSQHGRPLHPASVVCCRVRLLQWHQPTACSCSGTSPQPALVVAAFTEVGINPHVCYCCGINPLAHSVLWVCASEAVTTIVPYLVARAPLSAPHSERIQLTTYSQFVVLSRSLRSLPADDGARSLRSLLLMMCAFLRSLRSLCFGRFAPSHLKMRIASLAPAR